MRAFLLLTRFPSWISPSELKLEDAIEFSENSDRLVGVHPETGEFDVFAPHEEGKYHGYQVEWGELTQKQQSALRKGGFVN